jgi:two-component system response regulator CpxR
VRPKKKILLIDSNENSASVRSYVLRTMGRYAVDVAANRQQALALASGHTYDLVIGCWPMRGSSVARVMIEIHELCTATPRLLLTALVPKAPLNVPAEATLCIPSCTSADVLQRVRILCQSKRGPSKGFNVHRVDHAMAMEERKLA